MGILDPVVNRVFSDMLAGEHVLTVPIEYQL